jgi:hypothetical protein
MGCAEAEYVNISGCSLQLALAQDETATLDSHDGVEARRLRKTELAGEMQLLAWRRC